MSKKKDDPDLNLIYKKFMLTPITWGDDPSEEENTKDYQSFTLRLDPVTHKKIKWLVENDLGSSMQAVCLSILRRGVNNQIDNAQRMIAVIQEDLRNRNK